MDSRSHTRKSSHLHAPSQAGTRHRGRAPLGRSPARHAQKYPEASGARVNDYMIVLEKGSRNYSAYCPDIPGCIATGKTRAKTEKSMREALAFHIDFMREKGEAVPPPSSVGAIVRVSNPIDDTLADRLSENASNLKIIEERKNGHVRNYDDFIKELESAASGTKTRADARLCAAKGASVTGQKRSRRRRS